MGIVDTANGLADEADNGNVTRQRKRALQRDMKKAGKTQEEIDYAMMQIDNGGEVAKVFKKCLADLLELGYTISGQTVWHNQGCNIQTGVAPADFNFYKQNKKSN